MKIQMHVGLIAGCFAALSGAASADVLYANTPAATGDTGDCVFNQPCGSGFTSSNTYGGQQFTLSGVDTITGLGFYSIDFDGTGYSVVNWQFLANDGTGGLPGTLIASGTVNNISPIGSVTEQVFTHDFYDFGIAPFTVGPGSYTVAFNVIANNDNFAQYLSSPGADLVNASVESDDGGSTWFFGYGSTTGLGQGSAAVEVDGTAAVPEPASLSLIGVGMAGLGILRKRKSR